MAGINIINLHKEYLVETQTIQVLNGIDLYVPEHKITVILGRSGCGKTTLLRLVGGLETWQKGEIQKNNTEKTAFVFQEPRLMPWLDVRKNIMFGLNRSERKHVEIDEIIRTVNLNGFEKAYPNQLSGGMQQRVAIARALTYKPAFIMMDEPFAALDYFTREQMQQELLKVQKQRHCGILFVTHSIDEALLLAHKIVVLENGKVKASYEINQNHMERNLLDDDLISIKKSIVENLYFI